GGRRGELAGRGPAPACRPSAGRSNRGGGARLRRRLPGPCQAGDARGVRRARPCRRGRHPILSIRRAVMSSLLSVIPPSHPFGGERTRVWFLTVLMLLLVAGPAWGHALLAKYHVLPGRKVQVDCRFDDDTVCPDARVQVLRADGTLL